MEPLYTASLTIIGGILIYTIGHILETFVIRPINDQRTIISEIASALIFYANIFFLYKELDPRAEKACAEFRVLASRLRSNMRIIPFYFLWEKLRVVIRKNDVRSASSALIGLANSIYNTRSEHMQEFENRICTSLGLEME